MAESEPGQQALAAAHSALLLFGFIQSHQPSFCLPVRSSRLEFQREAEAIEVGGGGGGGGLGYLSRVTGLLPLPGTSLQFPDTHSLPIQCAPLPNASSCILHRSPPPQTSPRLPSMAGLSMGPRTCPDSNSTSRLAARAPARCLSLTRPPWSVSETLLKLSLLLPTSPPPGQLLLLPRVHGAPAASAPSWTFWKTDTRLVDSSLAPRPY